MIIYKLGCIWGKGAPDFYEMIKSKSISLSHTHDCKPKKDSVILITNGHTIKAITILLEDCKPVTTNPELKDSFAEYNISYNNETLYAKSKWIELKPEDYFLFKTQDGICQVHKPEIHQITKSLLSKYMLNENLEKKIELLKFKKQIILQGPPGTGKTREAKLIAESLLGLNEIVEIDFFREILVSTKKIPATKNNNSFYIESFNNDIISFKSSISYNNFSYSLIELYECYTSNDFIKEDFVNYPQYSKRCTVIYILNNYKKEIISEQFKLIQFHPSYTYEDFVRGIVSKPTENGDGVLFETENKVMASFAEKALNNFKDSEKGITELSLEKWLNEQFEKFIFHLSEKLEKEEKIEVTESVFIVELDEDAFRYKGLKGWNKKGNRMLFKDIKQAFIDENLERQDIKQNQNLSGLAKWHASYYIRVLDMFKTFLKDEGLSFKVNSFKTEKLKNYVLIIDEINRANLPSVLGELIYALEYRDQPVESMYAIDKKNELILPSNLFIIGTMNTADRSVGHIDYAIKRRFAFVDILPSDQAIDDVINEPSLNTKAKDLYKKVAELFNEDKEKNVYLQSDFKAKDVQLGHSYFLAKTEKQLELKLEFEIKPLLFEYVKDGILSEETIEEISKL